MQIVKRWATTSSGLPLFRLLISSKMIWALSRWNWSVRSLFSLFFPGVKGLITSNSLACSSYLMILWKALLGLFQICTKAYFLLSDGLLPGQQPQAFNDILARISVGAIIAISLGHLVYKPGDSWFFKNALWKAFKLLAFSLLSTSRTPRSFWYLLYLSSRWPSTGQYLVTPSSLFCSSHSALFLRSSVITLREGQLPSGQLVL